MDRGIQPDIRTIENIHIPEIQETTLDNGIPVLVINGGTQDVLKINLIVPAGSIYAHKKLIAPMCGLMLHEGSENYNAHELAEIFDFYGAYFQPTIEKDLAHIGLFVLNKHLDKTLPVFSDIVFKSKFPDNEFSILKDRRKQNFLVENQKTAFKAKEKFFELLFGTEHAYGICTKTEHYEQLENNWLKSFYHKQYQSGDFKVICSGRVSEAEMVKINRYFGQHKINPGKPQPQTTMHTAASVEPFIIKMPDAVQSSIRMGLLTVPKTHPDYVGLKILTTLLGGYFGSRLMKNIREEKGYTYGIHAMQVSLLEAGYIAIAADVKAEFTKESVEEIKKEVIKLQTIAIDDAELQLVRNYMMGELIQLFDGPFNTSEAAKGTFAYALDLSYYKTLQNKVLNISAKELMDLANKYLELNNFVTVVAGKY